MSEIPGPDAGLDTGYTNVLVPDVRGLGLALCPEAEPRMAEALDDAALIVVNGLMAVKCAGDTVGVPLREEDLPGGRTVLTAWYGIDYGGRDGDEWYKRTAIRDAFVCGETHIDLPGVTNWILLREVKTGRVTPGGNFIETVRGVADALRPGARKIAGLSRLDYLNRHLTLPHMMEPGWSPEDG